MARRLLAFDHPSDPLTSLKSSFAAASFLATVLAGFSAYKFLVWRGEKWIPITSRFAAGVFLGTAMIECLSESHALFHNMGFRYPVAFLLTCAGYLVAMLVECVLARVVQMLSQRRFTYTSLGDLRSIKSSYATLPVGSPESETKYCDDIGYHQNPILHKAIQIGDGFFFGYILSVFSAMGGVRIGLADTETNAWKDFLSTIFHNIIYVVSLISLLLKFTSRIPITYVLLLLIVFSIFSPAGVVLTFILPNNDSTVNFQKQNSASTVNFQKQNNDSKIANESVLVSILFDETINKWTHGIFIGFFPGVLVYLLAQHLLVDGYEMKGSVPGTRFGRFLALVFGVGLIALVNMLDVY